MSLWQIIVCGILAYFLIGATSGAIADRSQMGIKVLTGIWAIIFLFIIAYLAHSYPDFNPFKTSDPVSEEPS